MYNKIPMCIVTIACLITAIALFNIKDNVLMLRSELKEVKKQIQYEIDTIKVLQAELAYLTSPKRLKLLATRYLELQPVEIDQIISDPLNSESKEVKIIVTDTKPADTKPAERQNKWRYKRGPRKYLTAAAEAR